MKTNTPNPQVKNFLWQQGRLNRAKILSVFLAESILLLTAAISPRLARAGGGGGGGGVIELPDATFESFSNLPTVVDKCSSFSATITMRNTGDVDWTAAGGFSLKISSSSWGTTTVNLPNGVTVAKRLYNSTTGAYTYSNYGFVGTFTAPCTPGTYTFQARMQLGENVFGSGSPAENIRVNDAPTASSASVSVNKNESVAISLSASDPDGDTLSYTIVSSPSHGALSGSGAERTYTPNEGYYGSDSFTFYVSDGRLTSTTATVSITVVDPNVAPVAASQSVNVDYQLDAAITLSATDANGDALTYIVTLNPAHGTLSGVLPNLTYTPATGYSGEDSFSFKANDGELDSAIAVVSITVGANPNTPPVASAQNVDVVFNTPTAIVLSATDANGDGLSYSIVGLPAQGSLSGVAPNVIYTPVTGYSGSDSFTFKANDGSDDSNIATVSITVAARVNVAPIANAQSVEVPYNTATSVILSATDPDDFELSFVVVTPPAHGTLSGSAPEFTYTPADGYSGSDSFTFTASDATDTSAPAVVSITVLPKPNAAPVAVPQTVSVQYESETSFTLSASDEDNDELTYSIGVSPLYGSLSGEPPHLTYTPNLGTSGEDSFTFVAHDGALESEPALVMITISDPPAPGITTPTQLTLPGEIFQLVAGGAAADATTCGLMSNGEVYCWGANNTQQCGINAEGLQKVDSPVLIPEATGASEVSTSGNHTCVIVNNSQVKCMGANSHGQLGDRSTASSKTLKKVEQLY